METDDSENDFVSAERKEYFSFVFFLNVKCNLVVNLHFVNTDKIA